MSSINYEGQSSASRAAAGGVREEVELFYHAECYQAIFFRLTASQQSSTFFFWLGRAGDGDFAADGMGQDRPVASDGRTWERDCLAAQSSSTVAGWPKNWLKIGSKLAKTDFDWQPVRGELRRIAPSPKRLARPARHARRIPSPVVPSPVCLSGRIRRKVAEATGGRWLPEPTGQAAAESAGWSCCPAGAGSGDGVWDWLWVMMLPGC